MSSDRIYRALLCLASLLLVTPAVAQEAPAYTVWGTYNFLRVELRVDESAGIAHVRLTNTSANVVDLGWGPLDNDRISPYRDFSQLPFRGSFISPSRDSATIKLKPGEVFMGDLELIFPETSDGPFTHWCYKSEADVGGQFTFFSLCAPIGAAP